MQMARVFFSGGEQFVQLPPEFCFKSNEVDIFRRGAEVVLVEKPEAIGGALEEVIEGLTRSAYLRTTVPSAKCSPD